MFRRILGAISVLTALSVGCGLVLGGGTRGFVDEHNYYYEKLMATEKLDETWDDALGDGSNPKPRELEQLDNGSLYDISSDVYVHYVRPALSIPIRKLYLEGPSSWGFWAGRSESAVCGYLTQTDERLWLANMNECSDMIDRTVISYVITIEIVLWMFTVYLTLVAMKSCVWMSFVTFISCCFYNCKRKLRLYRKLELENKNEEKS